MSADVSPDRQQSSEHGGDAGGPPAGSTGTLATGDTTNGSVNGSAYGAPPPPGVEALLPGLLAGLDRLVDGDFGVRLPIGDGVGGDVARRFNELAGMQERHAREVSRVSKVIRRDGRLTLRMDDLGGSGGWDELTQSVNSLIDDLARPTHEVARVIAAVAEGDLSQQMALEIAGQPVRGEFLRIGTTVNTMVDQLSSFADEVTRVAREVGTEGNLGGQAKVMGVSGVWRDLTESVNSMAGNLTSQVRNIAQVTTAVAQGDLSQKITVDARGEIHELKSTVNTMVDQLSAFADEVTRVAKEVGTEGKLGGQAKVMGVSGVWRDLTDSVNIMAGNLTTQVRSIAEVAAAVARGDLTRQITVDARGEVAGLAHTLNTMVDQLSSFADEVTRVAWEVGTEGNLGGQAHVRGVSGVWRDLTESVNSMAGNLTSQVRNIALVATAVARGDLSQKITVTAQGEILELKETLNTMVDQLSSFADEVTRVAREVGTEGNLGGQAHVRGVSGVWRDLTESVNSMAGNLTTQVRNISAVTTAVARGDLSQKITVTAQGEIAELKDTVNTMVDQLSSFAIEITRVGREVGVEGKLGGQATVAGVAGTWRDLTDNVNQLATTLTIQLRAIGDVSTAVTRGDLTRSITVEAEGEVAELKDNINQMIARLRETTEVNAQQDWLKSNLALIGSKMQGQRDLYTVCQMIISEMTPAVNAQQGTVYLLDFIEGDKLRYVAGYGSVPRRRSDGTFLFGEGLIGQAALEKKRIRVEDVPAGYLNIRSGLGEAPPCDLVVVPVIFENQVLGVIELASFTPFSDLHLTLVDQLVDTIGVVLNTIMANARTEELLAQSQRLTQELRSQSVELQRTNNELEEKAALLEEKNTEIDMARIGLEEKAEQLALSSQYKSEFLANMSHELRTPLNSLLILAKLLADNPDHNLSQKQIDFAETIHSAGSELLGLINDILDLSKVEAGKMNVDAGPVRTAALCDAVAGVFGPTAEEKGLTFEISVTSDVPEEFVTDEQRIQQVLKNLLSNAVKFTDSGTVRLDVSVASPDTPFVAPSLRSAPMVLSFAVSDTGIGVAAEKLRMIFEAFQQADGTTSRRYGGTGLGLSISKEIARLLGGSIAVSSQIGQGSTFTLFVPSVMPAEVPAVVIPGEPDGVLMIVEGAGGARSRLEAGGDGGRGPGLAGAELAAPDRRQGPGFVTAGSSAEVGPGSGSGFGSGSGRTGVGLAGAAGPAAPGIGSAPNGEGSGQAGRSRVGERTLWSSRASDGNAVDPRSDGGTPFLTDPSAVARPPAANLDSSDPLVGASVLVVDDDVRNVFALTSALEMHGMRVLYADNGHDAIRMLQQDSAPVHLVLMDVMLPGMDGNETTSAIRAMPAFAPLPILVLTAKAMPGDREKSISAGATDYITKPVDLDHLLGVMRSHL
ncbi:HAMP domain-containing protein [Parafrankia sp. EUN1f]|uniref:HAMP domain-containing protein n=1 Tax=Parafrankia sp. EUN1f TaxID=102897 RepID=UPI0001C45E11|nr:HAMP domain-containing protein [Parafrankia sp. EUN1f]EFC83982.1 GAF sensor hybrid histidine kinase [Parafrankia sp. EUN1f]